MSLWGFTMFHNMLFLRQKIGTDDVIMLDVLKKVQMRTFLDCVPFCQAHS